MSHERRDSHDLSSREFRLLSRMIHDASGVSLGEEKRYLLAARLRPLLAELGVATYGGLAAAASDDKSGEKLALLVDRATTNTTGFFRHPAHFDLLRVRLDALAQERGKLRVWSVGCSTGEEPYSIALVLAASRHAAVSKVLATDVSHRALERARTAVYDEEDLVPVPPTLRGRFTRTKDGRFELDREVRSLVHLRHHDLRGGGEGARDVFDAVFCRNVLIYFEPDERARAVSRLARVLRTRGLFFLGPSESGVALPGSFARVGPAAYEKV